ncbi:pol I core factor CF [Penicillium lagena]|uniref:pol I core factor CF n=1 Tax=Penicillium lagena TaxID=94218 RepID=UPI002540C759|nr:pol I core factor CF [Penicillium lagena]KAJ5601312.1 pol I core factor CF [Penicillium lagena]
MVEYVTRGVCGQEGCRTRRYYLDEGLWFCKRGHRQVGVQVEEDPEDFAKQGKTHRVKRAATEKSRKTYRGRQAYTLFLQAYQLILWKQCHVLVREQGFPEQFENVVRDLWALRLQDYALKINESLEEDESEPELFSSQPTEKDESPELGFKPRGKYLAWPRLIDSIGLCYLAALVMRLPICVSDFHRLVIRQDVPYIRVVREIPREMRDKFPPEYLSLLEVSKLPKAGHFQRAFFELQLFYERRFGVVIPPLNSPLILYRHIKRLAVPVEVYEAVKKLQDIVGFTYQYPFRKQGRKTPLHLPDVQIMALIVIATKLLFPFDNVKRYPTTSNEPAAQTMDWNIWAQAHRHFDSHDRPAGDIGKGNAIHVTDKDVLNMTPAQMDQYMDWYANSWLDTSGATNPLAGMFPTTQPNSDTDPPPSMTTDPDEALETLLHTVIQDLRPRRVVPTEEQGVSRPGSRYQRCRPGSTFTGPEQAFYELTAQLAAVSEQTLLRAVSHTETRIERFLDDQKLPEDFRESGPDALDGDVLDDLDEQMTDLVMGDGMEM